MEQGTSLLARRCGMGWTRWQKSTLMWGGYVFCANNPVVLVDPDGREIEGATSNDAQKFKADILLPLNDAKFDNFKKLINVKGKTFQKIDNDKYDAALKGVELSDDERAYADLIVSTINSKEKHRVEYLDPTDYVSSSGSRALDKHFSKTMGSKLYEMKVREEKTVVNKDTGLSSIEYSYHWKGLSIQLGKEGLAVPSGSSGSHAFILNSSDLRTRAVTSIHEVFGHGIPFARGILDMPNNTNAIRADNLMRRLLGMPQRDGSNHAGGKVASPSALPMQ